MSTGDFSKALNTVEIALKLESDNTDLLYFAAVCSRYLHLYDQALTWLETLKSIIPEHGRAYQEEGYLRRELNQPELALQAFALAWRYNPALESSCRAALELATKLNQPAEIQQVSAQLAALARLPKILIAATDLVAEGKLIKAEAFCRQHLQKNPTDVEGMRLLADIGLRLGVLDDAEFLLKSACEFEPENTAVRIEYIQALRKRQKFHEAVTQAKLLLDSQPDNPRFQSLYAVENMQAGDFEAALVLFDQILTTLPGDPVTLTSKGHALKTRGDFDESVATYQEAIKFRPNHGEAWYSLANLKTYRFSEAELAEMQRLEDGQGQMFMDKVYLSFAKAKAFEDLGDFKTSFDYYQQGNDLKKRQSRYSAEQMTEEFSKQKQVCSAELLATDTGDESPDPIFIVGMPRAGSTLLEQILASHPLVDGTLELPNVLSLTQYLRRLKIDDKTPGYPEILPLLSGEKLREFGETYLRETQIHRHGAPYFIDKMPNNFRHIGLIHLMLPQAKIIDARRAPLSCCFSGYKQLFAEGQEFSYGLDEIGRYYKDYVSLMDHWHKVLPDKILHVQYEDVVSDLETQVNRILDYCGLPFDSACVEFYNTRRSIRTPSSEQVRQPIFQSGLQAWQPFEQWLTPLKNALD
ncbi:MAG: tetratricopeptide (TPR) repeat protein [Candidatus Azotimanducaceae bacterium]|jgi:tetratricopeptide (TPR) repeat protein